MKQYPAQFEGENYLLSYRRRYAGEVAAQTEEASAWLKKKGIPTGIQEAVQEYLDEGGVLDETLFRIDWEIECLKAGAVTSQ